MTAEPFNAKLILTVGLPGSGKSVWARQQVIDDNGLAARYPKVLVVERDLIRLELTGDMRNHAREMEVTRIAQERVGAALWEGCAVIVSDTNLKPRYRNEWMGLAGRLGASVEVKSFLHVPLEVCIERDAARPNPVGEAVIRRMHKYLLDSGQLPL